MSVSQRQRRSKQKRAPQQREPMTPIQRFREHLLIDLGVSRTDIARALGLPVYRITNVFTDRNRSLGPNGVEQRVVNFLIGIRANDPNCPEITRESMGWPETAETNETPAIGDEAVAGES